MGLFDKLKGAVNAITGGSAAVTLNLHSTTINKGSEFYFTVDVKVKDQSITVNSIYFRVWATETVKVIHNEVVNGNSQSKEKVETRRIHEFVENISGSQVLDANQTYSFNGQFTIPAGCESTFNVHPRKVSWEADAGLDMKGNDPDSKNIEIIVQ
ncbi:MAG: hypothetical protein U0U66_02885 [Cytophagaceae bacterium]